MNRHEIAAKTYCKIKGLDPDKMTGYSVEGSGAYYQCEYWKLLADEFVDLEIRIKSLRAAQEIESQTALPTEE